MIISNRGYIEIKGTYTEVKADAVIVLKGLREHFVRSHGEDYAKEALEFINTMSLKTEEDLKGLVLDIISKIEADLARGNK